MCGIIGYNGNQDPKNILLDGLKKLEYRGYDSAGIAVLDHEKIQVFRAEGRLSNLELKLADRSFDGSLGIGHTRWATHGAPTEINAHPHRVGSITLVHNGIIENYMDHKEAMMEMGRPIMTETDSEIVAHLLDCEIQRGRSLKMAIANVVPRLTGAYAFVILNDAEPDVVAGIRNGPPLLVGIGEREMFLASDVQAVLHRTNRIVYLEDRQYVICAKDKIEIWDFDGKPVTPQIKSIHWTPEQMEKAGYKHYMLKEIHEQSQALANTIENNIDHKTGIVSLPELGTLTEKLKTIQNISIVACGTARHAALVGKYYIERFARVPVDVDFGSEFRYRNPILTKDSLTIVISQSGETADTLAGLRESKSQNIPTVAICNVRDATIAREADAVLYTNAGPEIGVASTKAFTTQLSVLYMFAVQLGHMRSHLNTEAAEELTRDLLQLPILVDKTLSLEPQIEKLAAELQDLNFFFYMGRDVNYPIALEGALKLKEISYAHAEGYAAGELKHGPIALIDKHTAVIITAPRNRPGAGVHKDVIYEKILSNLQQVKSRGGIIVTVGTEGDTAFPLESKYFVGVPRASWAMNPILLSIPAQLLAYHIALQRGTDVDKPRNLAKSVTVE
jgi:glutamine---fructose-6-phosphate transaminase (isomerizing)